MTTARPAGLAYLVSRFPTVTETFILREIIELERQGMPLSLYTIIHDKPDVIHDDAKPWVARLREVKTLSWRTLKVNLQTFLAHPVLYVSLLWLTVHDLWGCWNFLLRDLVLFPKAVVFARMMQAEGIRHVHAHWATHTAYAAYIIHRLNGISYSFTAHAHDIYIRKAMLCRKVQHARFVITISHFNVDELARDCGEAVREKIHVVRCGVDPDQFHPRAHHHHKEGQPFTILTVASLRDYKGHPYAIRACQILKQRMNNFRWLVVGGGPDRAALEALIHELGVGDVFHLSGAKTEHVVREMMDLADVFVTSSIKLPDRRMDGIPVALMEALAVELPTVAANVSGIPELVEDNVTGRLVPERDPEALAEAILDLREHPDKARALAQAGRQRVLDEFTVPDNTARLVPLFRAALEARDQR